MMEKHLARLKSVLFCWRYQQAVKRVGKDKDTQRCKAHKKADESTFGGRQVTTKYKPGALTSSLGQLLRFTLLSLSLNFD